MLRNVNLKIVLVNSVKVTLIIQALFENEKKKPGKFK